METREETNYNDCKPGSVRLGQAGEINPINSLGNMCKEILFFCQGSEIMPRPGAEPLIYEVNVLSIKLCRQTN